RVAEPLRTLRTASFLRDGRGDPRKGVPRDPGSGSSRPLRPCRRRRAPRVAAVTTRVNEAYRTLKNTVQRGRHLLELREELEAATGGKDSSRLDGLRSRLRLQETKLESEIAEAIDGKKDYAGAAELVRKLMFLERLDAEIDSAYETIEQ